MAGFRVEQQSTVTVTLSGVSISSAKAAQVLEQYGREKVRRREYMREYRKPEDQGRLAEKKPNGDDRRE